MSQQMMQEASDFAHKVVVSFISGNVHCIVIDMQIWQYHSEPIFLH